MHINSAYQGIQSSLGWIIGNFFGGPDRSELMQDTGKGGKRISECPVASGNTPSMDKAAASAVKSCAAECLILDSNVLMDRTQRTGFECLGSMLRRRSMQWLVPETQLNELEKLKGRYHHRSGTGRGARFALMRVEEFLGAGYIDICPIKPRQPATFADPVFIDMLYDAVHDGRRLTIVSQDRALRIRLRARSRELGACKAIRVLTWHDFCGRFSLPYKRHCQKRRAPPTGGVA